MMKKNTIFLAFCGLFAATSIAQVTPSSQPETNIWGVVNNTGIAIAPDVHWNAIAYDDPSGFYQIEWRDANTTALYWQETHMGQNPDVAYYSNLKAVVVGYENSGDIYVDDYYWTGSAPGEYPLGLQTGISSGINPNIDMSSKGNGVLTWEDAGTVYLCAYDLGGTVWPILAVASGTTPDIALMDDNSDVVITYVDGGMLITETFLYSDIATIGAALSPTSAPVMIPSSGSGYEFPRIQSNRNSLFGPPDMYTIVAQDDMGGMYDVWGYFFAGSGNIINASFVNDGINTCSPSYPRPVVAYDRDQIHIAFSQDYTCAPIISPPNMQDILVVQYDLGGNYFAWSTTPGPGTFQEVNNNNLDYTLSATSLNTEYDGNYLVYDANFCEGIVFNDPGDAFWKVRLPSNPFWRTSGPDKFTVSVDKGVSSNLIIVEVATKDESVSENDLDMSFALYDQSGRVVDIPAFEQEGMIFRIDASSLEHGIYLLHYTLNGETKAARIPHFTN
jgi:hypothetical protein